jgi:hypothetical protein
MNIIRDCILKYKLYRQQTLLDVHYIIANNPNYVKLMKTYVKSKCKLPDNYCINVFRDPEFIINTVNNGLVEPKVPLLGNYSVPLENAPSWAPKVPLQQIYLIIVYYNDEMYVYKIPYTELSQHKLSIYDEWITKYRVLLVMY